MAGHGVRRLRAVLRALWTAMRREQESLMKVPANNLYYAAAAFFFMLDPAAAAFVGAIGAMVLFFPLSSDPLRHIPRSRFQLWPLEELGFTITERVTAELKLTPEIRENRELGVTDDAV